MQPGHPRGRSIRTSARAVEGVCKTESALLPYLRKNASFSVIAGVELTAEDSHCSSGGSRVDWASARMARTEDLVQVLLLLLGITMEWGGALGLPPQLLM